MLFKPSCRFIQLLYSPPPCAAAFRNSSNAVLSSVTRMPSPSSALMFRAAATPAYCCNRRSCWLAALRCSLPIWYCASGFPSSTPRLRYLKAKGRCRQCRGPSPLCCSACRGRRLTRRSRPVRPAPRRRAPAARSRQRSERGCWPWLLLSLGGVLLLLTCVARTGVYTWKAAQQRVTRLAPAAATRKKL